MEDGGISFRPMDSLFFQINEFLIHHILGIYYTTSVVATWTHVFLFCNTTVIVCDNSGNYHWA